MDKSDHRRDDIIDLINKELIGPDPVDWPGMIQENGEEILASDTPGNRYIAGVLYPRDSIISEQETPDLEEEFQESDEDYKDQIDVIFNGTNREYLEDMEELMDRSNAYNQSAMSITVAIKNTDLIYAEVYAAQYDAVTTLGEKTPRYYRKPITWNSEIPIDLPTLEDRIKSYSVEGTFLQLDFTFRMKRDDYSIYTVTIENTREKKKGVSFIDSTECYFQVKMQLTSEQGFMPLPDGGKINADDDYKSNQLLYRNVKNFAIGHGCAADWKQEDDEKVFKISTAVFPVYEVKPIVPSSFKGLSLSMKEMSDPDLFKKIIADLSLLCEKYREWIKSIDKQKSLLEKQHMETAERHIKSCWECYNRMINGVNLLIENSTVRQAFQWMNRAMLMQQLRYNLPLRRWVPDTNNDIKLEYECPLPLIDEESTWFDVDHHHYGNWRPFQIAFVLMNLSSMYDDTDPERKIVDLIWFPTGGGKTEAYLGLSAYTIFIRRLKDKSNAGTAIIMRYTLRLLTAQQYERASSLICACEKIRAENTEQLGEDRISIGLWVGGSTTPNKQKGSDGAIKCYEKLYNGKTNENPFVLLKCPWCGAQMGVVDYDGMTRKLPGYIKKRVGPRQSRFAYACRNNKCDFNEKVTLPLYVVDEDIYEYKPTLLIGTVDKFAILPFKPEARGIFGFDDEGKKITSPDLIIQDELHLISGPLGSMVGHYETMISDLCVITRRGHKVLPKIIASTATISRARQQCKELYACKEEQVFQFPPSGLDAGDSFFAKEDKKSNGRKYVGILASNSPSDATTAIRLYASLLYAAKKIEVHDESERDPYWTNVGYYNSIRELGQARTWIKADIDQHLDVMYKRRHDDQRFETYDEYKTYRRYIYKDEELTSRIPGNRVTESLANLTIKYPHVKQKEGVPVDIPIDICLATNMISVGLDVSRLGLMTVAGQPKTTSEYIQATSRVGRDGENAPGLIFVLYRPGRPRDKSYYEQFVSYHSKLYCHVEPTSVTPFAAPVRDRALMAIMTGIMRLENGISFNENPPLFPQESVIDHVYSVIEERLSKTDPDELDDTLDEMEYLLQEWKDWSPEVWTPKTNYDGTFGEELPLIYGAGNNPNEAWLERGICIPTSMRNVDSSCEAQVLLNRYVSEED